MEEEKILDVNNLEPNEAEEFLDSNSPTQEEIDEKELRKEKKLLSKEKREKYRALQIAKDLERQLLEERAAVQHIIEENSRNKEAALLHYDSTLRLEIDQAKREKLKALEEGDYEKALEADISLSKAIARDENLKSWKSQEAYRNQMEERYSQQNYNNYPPPQQNAQPQINEPTAGWLNKNTWFNSNSPDFDPEKAAAVEAFSRSLDFRLHRTGRANQILSKAYFDEIDKYSRQMDEEDYGDMSPREEFTMNNKNANFVAPVRKNSGLYERGRTSEKVILTADEKELAQRLRVTPEQFLKSKIQEMKKSNIRNQNMMAAMARRY